MKTVEHIEEGLENCRGIELSSRDLKTVAISVTRALSNVAGKSSYAIKKNVSASGGGVAKKTVEHIEQGLENCRAYRAYRAGT